MPNETVEIRGHLVDSLILPKVLDEILSYNGAFEILKIEVGRRRIDPSYAQIRIEAPSREDLEKILRRVKEHGAEILDEGDVTLALAPQDGVFPPNFYVTTNLQTFIRHAGEWMEVAEPRMDGGIVFDAQGREARVLRFSQVKRGDLMVVGHRGVRVVPLQRSTPRNVFEFMASSVSSEKPKGVVIQEVATQIKMAKQVGDKILVVAGPAVINTGAGPHLVRMIELGFVDILFAGNALAVHDIEQALYGTSLGIYLEKGMPAVEGHENHIRAINAIRQVGDIREAVAQGLLKAGIMHACIQHGVEYVLAGSIRDDGPMPGVITDALQAQDAMAAKTQGVALALMVASSLHSIATANLLPAQTKIVCVDINPAVITKLVDRGSFQTVGLVTDAELFFRELVAHLDRY
ncbi:MAG: TIGR00300 family protein [Chloroflexi bacterium]|nr:TIGR00300 family protein [Chloroflexota bacterium]